MRDIRSIVLLCVVLLAICAGWLITSGCMNSTAPTGFVVAWNEKFEPAWQQVVACWRFEPTHPIVIERSDCYGEYPQRYLTSASPTGAAYGEFDRPRTVTLCPDAGAAKHEFSHYVRYAMTGSAGQNFSGECYL